MKNNVPYLKRKRQTFNVLQKVGGMDLTSAITELAKVQQQQQGLRDNLARTTAALDNYGGYYRQSSAGGYLLVPELMASQSLYVDQLLQTNKDTEKQLEQVNDTADKQLKAVFKLKKTSQVVQDKIDQTGQLLRDLYSKQMDTSIAEIRRPKREE